MLVAPLWVAARAATGESACAPETSAVLAAPTPRYLRKLRRVARGRASDPPSVFVVKCFRNRMVMLLLRLHSPTRRRVSYVRRPAFATCECWRRSLPSHPEQ